MWDRKSNAIKPNKKSSHTQREKKTITTEARNMFIYRNPDHRHHHHYHPNNDIHMNILSV